MMKTLSKKVFTAIVTVAIVFGLSSCTKDDDNGKNPDTNEFVKIESPYLICAGRNPGGIGFDFLYKNEKGGANYMDSLSVADFEQDIVIRTIRAERPNGTLGGAPFIKLAESVQAANYSAFDTTCLGIENFNNLNMSNIKEYTLAYDDDSFDISNVATGNTGQPLMSELAKEFKKLVIGQAWRQAANNDIENDEPIWIIKTREGRLVKLIVTDFPASPAPTPTGYIAITWDFVE